MSHRFLKVMGAALSMAMLLPSNVLAQKNIPLVYDKENSGATYNKEISILKNPCYALPDPLAWFDGNGRVKKFKQWEKRRNEIAASIQQFEIGKKPAVKKENIKAWMDLDTLNVEVTVNGEKLHLKSHIIYPKTGKAPYPLMIGSSMIALPRQLLEERGIAMTTFHEFQVNDYSQGQWRKHHDRGEHNFDRLYPELKDNGAYSEWAWGFSRLLDGLQLLGEEVTKIDMKHIGVTGCSYAGKMALFCGAFDERVALTIAQEPGGGGAAAWRVSYPMRDVESLERTDYHWFLESMKEKFSGENVYLLPHDRHALCAMVCPRALLVLGNPDFKWLADESAYVSMNAAKKVWEQFGIGDRVGYSIIAGHGHCQLPESQFPEVGAFLDRFLLGKEDVKTENIHIAPMFDGNVDVDKWIKW